MVDSRLESFFFYLKSKRVYVVGIGVSNNPLIRLLLKKGVPVSVCDKKTETQLGEAYAEIRSWGAAMLVGEDYPKDFSDADIIIRAPGVYFNDPVLTAARERGAVVTSEMELFFEYCPCPIFAVTGSEGKTTTTSIIAECLSRQGKLVHLGGNIGRGLFGIIENVSYNDVAVVELSSFQLLSMRASPEVAVITNITPNHLDIHGNMEEYIAAKKNIFLHQGAFSRCVLNADNAICASFSQQLRGEVSMFSAGGSAALNGAIRNGGAIYNGVFLENGVIYEAVHGQVSEIMSAADILLPGEHNVENYMAAFAAVSGRVERATMAKTAREFAGVKYRMQLVRELRGVKYYDDTIATSPTRVTGGCLRALKDNIILIAGGYDKKIPYEPLAEPVIKSCKALILTGDTSDKIEIAVKSHKDYDPAKLPIFREQNMEDAVKRAAAIAESGDKVALSPASASFDRYENFEKRGDHFDEIVNALI